MPTSITSSGITFDDATTLTTGVLTAANIASGAVTPAKLSQPLTLSTAVPTTSGLAIDFTPIPSWVRRITVILNGVSTDGTAAVLVQLGTSAGVQTTGYNCNILAVTSNNASTSAFTTGFAFVGGAIASARVGHMVITNINANTWVASMSGFALTTDVGAGQGAVALSGTLDRIRLGTVNDTGTFDAGTVNIIYEG